MAKEFECDGCGETTEGSPDSYFQHDTEGSFAEGPKKELCEECTQEILNDIQS